MITTMIDQNKEAASQTAEGTIDAVATVKLDEVTGGTPPPSPWAAQPWTNPWAARPSTNPWVNPWSYGDSRFATRHPGYADPRAQWYRGAARYGRWGWGGW
jgi:hypothetical protein